MRIGKRQERQYAIVVENLARDAAVRLFGTDRRDQSMMAVIPVRQRDIGFITQPGVGTVSTDHQARGQHVAALQGDKRLVFAPCHLLDLRRRNQRHVAALLCFLPERVVDHRVFNDVPQMAIAHAFIVKSNMTKAVFIPHFHAVIAAGAVRHNICPDTKVRQQLFAGRIDRRDAEFRRRIRCNGLRLLLLQHRHAQAAAL